MQSKLKELLEKCKLRELLDKYIAEYEGLKDIYSDYVTKCELYKELVSCFKTEENIFDNKFPIVILLESIYNDQIYEKEFYSLLYKLERSEYNSKNEIRSFLTMIDRDYSRIAKETISLKNRINRNRKIVSSARRARLSFKYNSPIEDTKYVVGDLRKIIDYYELSGEITAKDVLKCINFLDFYNRIIISTSEKGNKKEEDYTNRMYNEIPNILDAGYEVIEEPEVDISRKATLNRMVEEITNTLRCTKKDKILEYLESYEKYELDNNEYNYVIVNVLNNFNDELISYYQLLLDKETYSRIGNRKEIIEDYYTELIRYLVVRDYYNKYNEVIIEEKDIVLTEKEVQELTSKKKLIFSTSPANPTKAKIIGDMNDIPEEYYDTIYRMINNLMCGTIGKGTIRPLTNNKRYIGISELKDGGVRLFYKHIKDNIYNVIGVFIKKANTKPAIYQIMANRMIPDVSTEEKLNKQLELGEITIKQLADLIQTKGRKGTR